MAANFIRSNNGGIHAIVALASACSFVSSASAAEYDFSYRITGDTSIKPLQVFDDGVRTYMQFPSRMAELPAVVARMGFNDERMAMPMKHGPYWVLEGVAPHWELRFRSIRADVVSRKAAQAGYIPRDAGPGMSRPTYGFVSPVRGDVSAASTQAVQHNNGKPNTFDVTFAIGKSQLSKASRAQIAMAIPSAPFEQIRIIARDDDQYEEGVAATRGRVIREELERLGVPSSKIEVVQGSPRPVGKSFASDIVVFPSIIVSSNTTLPRMSTTMEGTSQQKGRFQDLYIAVESITNGFASLVRFGVIDSTKRDQILNELQSAVTKFMSGVGINNSTPDQRNQRPLRPANSSSESSWVAEQNSTLQSSIRTWAATSGMSVEWEASMDYPIRETRIFRGNLSKAVSDLLALTSVKKVPLTVSIDGQKLIVKDVQ